LCVLVGERAYVWGDSKNKILLWQPQLLFCWQLCPPFSLPMSPHTMLCFDFFSCCCSHIAGTGARLCVPVLMSPSAFSASAYSSSDYSASASASLGCSGRWALRLTSVEAVVTSITTPPSRSSMRSTDSPW
jgi:hypothetical protein